MNKIISIIYNKYFTKIIIEITQFFTKFNIYYIVRLKSINYNNMFKNKIYKNEELKQLISANSRSLAELENTQVEVLKYFNDIFNKLIDN
ncbi:MAG: hypothetical protein EOP34_11170 [Rickettsiales bacterium]|nr:MAG: hypothetical protein EOP34_11170 [Rickettsiales bacterium]